MNRFFYYLLGSLIALLLTLGAISLFRATAPADDSDPATAIATPDALPSATPAPTPDTIASPAMANMPSLIGATPDPAISAVPAPTPAPWSPPNYGKPAFLTYPGYTVVYSPTLSNPLAVQYAMVGGAKPRKWPEVPKIKTPAAALITQNGYARGSMALTKSITLYFGKQSGHFTELMTNSCAFNPPMLTGVWSQFNDLEAKWAGEAGWIEVVAGPIFGATPGQTANGLIVPVAFYRAYRRSYGDTIAFIIPQSAPTSDLSKYLTSISTIEASTGVAIFANTLLLEQRNSVATTVW
jgi:DNA/RNA endonuclease G (NUC1)